MLCCSLAVDDFADHVVQDPAVSVVREVDFCVEAEKHLKRAIIDGDRDVLAGLQVFGNVDRVSFTTRQAQRFGALFRQELQRDDPHANQVRAVDAFERLCDHRFDSL